MNIYMWFMQSQRTLLSLITLSFISTLLLPGCLGAADNPPTEQAPKSALKADAADAETVVILTPAQYQNAKIRLSMMQSKILSGTIEASGVIDVPPEDLISITPVLGGVLQSTPLQKGSTVKKGQVVAVLENPDFIDLQKEYLETKSQLQLATKEYERQQKLDAENVNSKKVLQKARSIYESTRISLNALRQRLQLINISADHISADHIQRQLNIYAPASGYITKVSVNKGKYVGDQQTMFEMVTDAPLHIDLKIFEQDQPRVKEGQKVHFQVAGDTTSRLATIELMEKSIGSDNTVTVHCTAQESGLNFMPGAYVKAKIETSPKPVPALPENAVVHFEGNSYVFIQITKTQTKDSSKADESFKMVLVNTGAAADGFLEIKAPYDVLSGQQIVVESAYDLLSQLKNEAE